MKKSARRINDSDWQGGPFPEWVQSLPELPTLVLTAKRGLRLALEVFMSFLIAHCHLAWENIH